MSSLSTSRWVTNRIPPAIGTADAERLLRRPVEFTVANDHETMTQAIDRGVSIETIKRKSLVGRDLDIMDKGLAAALGLEH